MSVTRLTTFHRLIAEEILNRGVKTVADGHSSSVRGFVTASNTTTTPQKATANDGHAAETVMRSAQLIGVGNWMQDKIKERLDGLKAELASEIIHDKPTGDETGKLFINAEKRIRNAFKDVQGIITQDIETVAGTIEDAHKKSLAANHGVTPGESGFNLAKLKVLGLTISETVEKFANDLLTRFKASIRIGINNGETPEELAKRVEGDDTVKAQLSGESYAEIQKTADVHYCGNFVRAMEAIKEGLHDDVIPMYVRADDIFNGLVTLGIVKAVGPLSIAITSVLEASANSFQTLIQNALTSAAADIEDGLFDSLGDDDKEDMGYTWLCSLEGTCFPAGQKVLTPEGLQNIESLKKGDNVIGGSGLSRKVVSTMSRKVNSIAELQLSNGETIRCTPDHLFLSDGLWVKASDLTAMNLTPMNKVEIIHLCDIQNELIGNVRDVARLNCEPKRMQKKENFVHIIADNRTLQKDVKVRCIPDGREENLSSVVRSAEINSSQVMENSVVEIVIRLTIQLKLLWHVLAVEIPLFVRQAVCAKGETSALLNVEANINTITQDSSKSMLHARYVGVITNKSRDKNTVQNHAWEKQSQRQIITHGRVEKGLIQEVIAGPTGKPNQNSLGIATETNAPFVARLRVVLWMCIIKFLSGISTATNMLTSLKIWNHFVKVATKNARVNLKSIKRFYRWVKILLPKTAMVRELTLQNLRQKKCSKLDHQKKQTWNLQKDLGCVLPQLATSETEEHGVICNSVKILDCICEVFDITVENDHSFVVGNVIVHNCEQCLIFQGAQWDSDINSIGDGPPYPGDPPESQHPNCRCVVTETDLSQDFKPTKIDEDFQKTSPSVLAAVFGKANSRAFMEGEISGKDLLKSGFKLSPDAFARLRPQMESI